MNLGMTVMASGNYILCPCCLDLGILDFSIFQAFFLEA
jgi:hypothetical protein